VVGTVARVADRLGYLCGQNFGSVFDVEAKPSPTDLAFTAYQLRAHSDLPYRQPIPGIQMLHCIRNEADGGDSTLVDGMAAAMALEFEHPDWHAALIDTEVVFRYDIGTDTVVNRGPILEYDRQGRYRQIRLNTKLDEPVMRPGVDLDAFYAGRQWLTEWTNDPAHQVTFRLEPGDIMFMDNQRALHGRTAFDPTSGHRHLQGCYIEHDGPDTMYRLAVRRRRAKLGA
jgi:gamma-butyrobetaine dioxygenase